MSAQPIETQVFAEVPARLRKSGTPPERLAAAMRAESAQRADIIKSANIKAE